VQEDILSVLAHLDDDVASESGVDKVETGKILGGRHCGRRDCRLSRRKRCNRGKF